PRARAVFGGTAKKASRRTNRPGYPARSKLFPPVGLAVPKMVSTEVPNRIGLIRHRIVGHNEIDAATRLLMTRQGVRLWPLGENPLLSPGYRYQPKGGRLLRRNHYTLAIEHDNSSALLSLVESRTIHKYRIRQFAMARLQKGSRFLADPVDGNVSEPELSHDRLVSGQIRSLEKRGEAFVVEPAGTLTGTFVLQPVIINGQRRFLFYKVGV
ncbi:MAG: hypothetical protein AB1744_12865, partial [Candidatus Zixiibacteriota bacterium]